MEAPVSHSRISGVLLVLLGALLFSTKAVMVKLAFRYEGVNAINLLLLRMLFSLPIYLAILMVNHRRKRPGPLTSRLYLEILAYGILGYYLASYFDFKGLEYISAGLERIILFIYPTFVVLINKLFFKKKVTKNQIWAMMICYLGVIITYLFEGQLSYNTRPSLGSALVLMSAVSYAAFLVGSGKLIPLIGTLRFTSVSMIISAIAVIIHCYLEQGVLFPKLPSEVYIYGLVMAVLVTVIPSFLISEGINRLGSSDASIIGSVGPISTLFLAYIFLGEEIGLVQILGTCMVIGGVFVVSAKPKTT